MENEKLDFVDAYRVVMGTDRGIRAGSDGPWSRLIIQDKLEYSHALLREDEGRRVDWWPHPDVQRKKIWQVEPEKPKDVFVWAYRSKESTFLCENKMQNGVCDESNCFEFTEKIALPIPECMPIKYRLIPADDPWPWRKFDPAKKLDEKWCLVLWNDGCISKAFYSCQRKGFMCEGKTLLRNEFIQAYIPIDEIPKPKLNHD